jgi:type I restriction enzyme S subunit
MLRYKEYKESGVEWIGEVPAKWDIKKFKFFGKMFAGLAGKKGDDFHKTQSKGTKPFISFTDIYNNRIVNVASSQFVRIEENEVQNRVRRGDLLFLMSSETVDDIGLCSLFQGDQREVYLNSFCKGFRLSSSSVTPQYLNYLLSCATYRNYFTTVGRGFTRVNIKQEYVKEVPILVPEVQEQTAIAHFLDRKTALIDRAIRQKERLIELLRERQQILIQRAVTRGLDPAVPLKDSGVEWIGEVPGHWEVMSIRHAFTFLNRLRIPISASERESRSGSYPYYGASGIIDYVDDYIFDEKTILIAEDGANLLSKSTALAFVAEGKYWVNNHAHILRPNFAGFTYWAELLSSIDYTTSISGAAQPKLTRENLGAIRIPVPPSEEIEHISNFAIEVCAKMDKVISQQSLQITKLREYRATLIDAAVTGKVKV